MWRGKKNVETTIPAQWQHYICPSFKEKDGTALHKVQPPHSSVREEDFYNTLSYVAPELYDAAPVRACIWEYIRFGSHLAWRFPGEGMHGDEFIVLDGGRRLRSRKIGAASDVQGDAPMRDRMIHVELGDCRQTHIHVRLLGGLNSLMLYIEKEAGNEEKIEGLYAFCGIVGSHSAAAVMSGSNGIYCETPGGQGPKRVRPLGKLDPGDYISFVITKSKWAYNQARVIISHNGREVYQSLGLVPTHFGVPATGGEVYLAEVLEHDGDESG